MQVVARMALAISLLIWGFTPLHSDDGDKKKSANTNQGQQQQGNQSNDNKSQSKDTNKRNDNYGKGDSKQGDGNKGDNGKNSDNGNGTPNGQDDGNKGSDNKNNDANSPQPGLNSEKGLNGTVGSGSNPPRRKAEDDRHCDMAHVEHFKPYCAFEDKILSDQDIVTLTDSNHDRVCKTCLTKYETVDVCAKKYWSCAKCDKEIVRQNKPIGTCPKCQATNWKGPFKDYALMIYACEECKSWWMSPQKCDNPTCKRFRTPATRKCAESGKRPHVVDE